MIKKWLASKFRRELQQAERPAIPQGGRSSVEETTTLLGAMNRYFDFMTGIDPVVPLEYLDFLTRVAIVNPDINHATTQFINLANNGHSLLIDARSDAVVGRALERLNTKAAELYPRSAGIDGLINQYLYQLAVTGAISSEDVVSPGLDGVKSVVIVPVRQIRFKREGDDYLPQQRLSDGTLIDLSDATYRYYAFKTVENSPYALPLYVSAIEPILNQRDMAANIKFVIRKLGLLGLVALSLTPPPKQANESQTEYEDRKRRYLNEVLKALQENYYKGLMVKFDDQTLEHHNINAEGRGGRDLWDLNEEQVASGMAVDPVMIGRPSMSTETFANVTYMFMVRQANNLRRLAKRRLERTYKLDLLLAGIDVDHISFSFNDNPPRDPLAEAQAEMNRVNNTIRKAQVGMIDPDTAAQELGYDGWFDPGLLQGGGMTGIGLRGHDGEHRVFRYDRRLERYRFVRPRAGRLSVMRQALLTEEQIRKLLEQWGAKYLEKVEPFLGKQKETALKLLEGFLRRSKPQDFVDPSQFASQAYGFIMEAYAKEFKTAEAKKAVREAVESIYQFYRIEDVSGWPAAPEIKFAMDTLDYRTVRFLDRVDNFYFSKYITNEPTERSVRAFLQERFIEGGQGLFGRADPAVLEEFLGLLDDKLGLSAYEAQRIIDTSVQRMRTWGRIAQYHNAGVEYGELHNPSPEAPICKFVTQAPYNIIPLGEAYSAVQRLSKMSNDEFAEHLRPIEPLFIEVNGLKQSVAEGYGFPPFHPNCHTTLLARPDLTAADVPDGLTRAEARTTYGATARNGQIRPQTFSEW